MFSVCCWFWDFHLRKLGVYFEQCANTHTHTSQGDKWKSKRLDWQELIMKTEEEVTVLYINQRKKSEKKWTNFTCHFQSFGLLKTLKCIVFTITINTSFPGSSAAALMLICGTSAATFPFQCVPRLLDQPKSGKIMCASQSSEICSKWTRTTKKNSASA